MAAVLKVRMELTWERLATTFAFIVGARAVASTGLGRLPGGRHRRSNGFEQHGKTTLCRHFAELCFKARNR